MLGVFRRVYLMERVHKRWKITLQAKHLVHGIIVITERVIPAFLIHIPSQYLLREQLLFVKVFIIIAIESGYIFFELGKQFSFMLNRSITQLGVMAINSQRLQQAQAGERFGAIKHRLDKYALEKMVDKERFEPNHVHHKNRSERKKSGQRPQNKFFNHDQSPLAVVCGYSIYHIDIVKPA